jgi:hypothetical protein
VLRRSASAYPALRSVTGNWAAGSVRRSPGNPGSSGRARSRRGGTPPSEPRCVERGPPIGSPPGHCVPSANVVGKALPVRDPGRRSSEGRARPAANPCVPPWERRGQGKSETLPCPAPAISFGGGFGPSRTSGSSSATSPPGGPRRPPASARRSTGVAASSIPRPSPPTVALRLSSDAGTRDYPTTPARPHHLNILAIVRSLSLCLSFGYSS